MRDSGDHTTTTELLLLPQDEQDLGAALAERLPGSAWFCSQPGPPGLHPVHLHGTLAEALACGQNRVQAFMPMPADTADRESIDDSTGCICGAEASDAAAILQLLQSPVQGSPPQMFIGRLAIKWNEFDVGQPVHETLTAQVRLAWQALRAATRPAHLVHVATGKPITRRRVGPAAYRLILDEGMPVTHYGQREFRLDP